jgi:D-amino-acid dehydrogenase
MARTDAVVLGAGIVGTSIALHLAKRGLSVALVDKGAPGEGTSYGNAGVIEANTLLPHPFPTSFGSIMKVALKQATEANCHLSFLPHIAPWLLDYRANSTMERRIRFANLMRPLFANALPEHEALMQEAGATRYLRKEGWLKVYRNKASFEATARERALASEFGLPHDALDRDGALALEPALAPQFVNGIYWKGSASVTNPLALTKAYIARFTALGGVVLTGDARTLHRANGRWRVETDEGPVDSREAVVALGPWATDLLKPMDIDLPLEVKRGYHLHFRPRGNAGLTRPVVDADLGYCVAPMEQGLRLTTGAEFADRDAKPTPVQFDRLLPQARALFPLGEKVEAQPWMGSRPCFADSMPVIGRAPGKTDLWLCYGHAHWGLTLGPVTGRLIAEVMTNATPFCDPTPYAAERFTR